MAATTDILGGGFAYPLTVDPSTGTTQDAQGVESVRAALRRLLDTAPGEQLMTPEYGCELKYLVFDGDTEEFRAQCEAVILDALARWEPRIAEVVALDVAFEDTTVRIALILRLVNSSETVSFEYQTTTLS